jgi:geranylgeranyl pyrophosphate synthase
MVTDFQEYARTIRTILENALKEALSSLLGGILVNDRSCLMASLTAGKKIRGCLTCMIAQALEGTLESAIPRATSVELIQAATLIHDDIVDQDTLRRGKPAAWTLEGPRRAVLIGDVIFASAIEMMSDLSKEDGSAVSRAIAQVSQGALREPLDPLALAGEIESGMVSSHHYDQIIRLKTGVLFGTACQMGAIAAGADAELVGRSYRYGLRIGEAYQIADDIQELKEHTSERTISPERMMSLAPSLLRFADGMQSQIPLLLQGRSIRLDDGTLDLFDAAVGLMECEIEHRLQSALSELEHSIPCNGYAKLLRTAPRDIINMFNTAS